VNTSDPTRYTSVAIALHWLMAIAIIGNLVLGLYMHELPKSDFKFELYDLHKSTGACLLALLFIRLAWRRTHTPPALPASMAAKEQRIAHGMVHGLYLFMLLSPLTGWLMSSSFGHPLVIFGLLPLPDLVGPNEALGKTMKIMHEVSNYALCTLFVLHTLASLKHYFKDHDDVLARMLPFLAPKP
jgi:cytochrome b561